MVVLAAIEVRLIPLLFVVYADIVDLLWINWYLYCKPFSQTIAAKKFITYFIGAWNGLICLLPHQLAHLRQADFITLAIDPWSPIKHEISSG